MACIVNVLIMYEFIYLLFVSIFINPIMLNL